MNNYFQTDEPVKICRYGKSVKFVQRMKSINDTSENMVSLPGPTEEERLRAYKAAKRKHI